MRPKSLRAIALTLVLALLFGQVGLSLMHTHQGQPGKSALALTAKADTGAAKCKACAIDGMPVLYVETATTLLLEFTNEANATPISGGLVLSASSTFTVALPRFVRQMPDKSN